MINPNDPIAMNQALPPQAQANIPAPALQVTASPVSTVAPPPQDTDGARFVNALAGFAGLADTISGVRVAQQNRVLAANESDRGVRDAMANPDPNAVPDTASATLAYREAYRNAVGDQLGDQLVTDLKTKALANAKDPDWLKNNAGTDIPGYVGQQISQALQGVSDPVIAFKMAAAANAAKARVADELTGAVISHTNKLTGQAILTSVNNGLDMNPPPVPGGGPPQKGFQGTQEEVQAVVSRAFSQAGAHPELAAQAIATGIESQIAQGNPSIGAIGKYRIDLPDGSSPHLVDFLEQVDAKAGERLRSAMNSSAATERSLAEAAAARQEQLRQQAVEGTTKQVKALAEAGQYHQAMELNGKIQGDDPMSVGIRDENNMYVAKQMAENMTHGGTIAPAIAAPGVMDLSQVPPEQSQKGFDQWNQGLMQDPKNQWNPAQPAGYQGYLQKVFDKISEKGLQGTVELKDLQSDVKNVTMVPGSGTDPQIQSRNQRALAAFQFLKKTNGGSAALEMLYKGQPEKLAFMQAWDADVRNHVDPATGQVTADGINQAWQNTATRFSAPGHAEASKKVWEQATADGTGLSTVAKGLVKNSAGQGFGPVSGFVGTLAIPVTSLQITPAFRDAYNEESKAQSLIAGTKSDVLGGTQERLNSRFVVVRTGTFEAWPFEIPKTLRQPGNVADTVLFGEKAINDALANAPVGSPLRGQRATIRPAEGSDPDQVRLYVTGQAMQPISLRQLEDMRIGARNTGDTFFGKGQKVDWFGPLKQNTEVANKIVNTFAKTAAGDKPAIAPSAPVLVMPPKNQVMQQFAPLLETTGGAGPKPEHYDKASSYQQLPGVPPSSKAASADISLPPTVIGADDGGGKPPITSKLIPVPTPPRGR